MDNDWKTRPTKTPYTYQDTLTAAQKANWRIEDIIGGDKQLDFTKAFIAVCRCVRPPRI